MTQTKKMIVLDNSTGRYFTTHFEHRTSDDMEISVDERLEELGFNIDECSWMAIGEDSELEEIED
jgi:hypothetical protein